MVWIGALGLGYQGGHQLTQAGGSLLDAAAWVGALSVPPGILEVRVAGRPIEYLEPSLLGVGQPGRHPPVPADFAARVAERIVGAAYQHGSAVLAVLGHPLLLNPVFPVMVERAGRAGIPVTVAVGVSAFDNLALSLGVDLLRTGVQMYDVRVYMQRKPVTDPSVPLVLFCVGYLTPEGAPPAQRRADLAGLVALLRARHGEQAVALHVRFTDGAGTELRDGIPLSELAAAEAQLDYASTLVVLPPHLTVWC